MRSIVRRTATTAAVFAAVAGASTIAANAANAGIETPLCKDADVHVTATPAQDSPSGHHAVALHYEASESTTQCTVSGAPYDRVFQNASGSPVGVNSSVENGKPGNVVIDPRHSATSYVLIPNGSEPGPASVSGLQFHLPSDASNVPAGVAWPQDSELTGTPQFTNLVQD